MSNTSKTLYSLFSKKIFLYGTLFSSILIPYQADASEPVSSNLSEVAPVNPLDPSISVDPVPAPPTDHAIHPSNMKPQKEKKKHSVKKNIHRPKKRKQKKASSKLKTVNNLDPYSFDLHSSHEIILMEKNTGGDPPTTTEKSTNTGELFVKLSGLLIYGSKND